MSTVNALLPSLMHRLGVAPSAYTDGTLRVTTPIDGSKLGCLAVHHVHQVQQLVDDAHQAFLSWRKTPAPRRGELIRLLGEELRLAKTTSVNWFRSKPEKFSQKAWVKCRR